MTSTNLKQHQVSNEPHQSVDTEERRDANNVEVEQVMALALEEESDKKPTPTVTIFSQEDDITLLQGFIRFRAENGPYNDWVKFHAFITDKLSHNRFTKTQVSEKMRRLRTRFLKNFKDGHELPNDPHESQVFELSKVLWNDQVLYSSISKRKTAADKGKEEKASKKQNTRQEYETKFPRLWASFEESRFALSVKENWFSFFERDKAQELEDRLRRLEVERFEVHCKMLEFEVEHMRKLLAANKSG